MGSASRTQGPWLLDHSRPAVRWPGAGGVGVSISQTYVPALALPPAGCTTSSSSLPHASVSTPTKRNGLMKGHSEDTGDSGHLQGHSVCPSVPLSLPFVWSLQGQALVMRLPVHPHRQGLRRGGGRGRGSALRRPGLSPLVPSDPPLFLRRGSRATLDGRDPWVSR